MKSLLAIVVVFIAGPAIAQGSFEFLPQPDGSNYSRVDDSYSALSAIDIVFIGDGFQASDMSDFDTAVQTCIYDSEVGDGLLGIEPYESSKCRLRFWRVQLVSPESGIDDPQSSTYVDTPLDCTFGSASDPVMKITGNAVKCVNAVEESGVPTWDYIVVIANTDRAGAYFPSGDGIIYLSSANAWGIYLAHELGHALADLGDEYECETCDPSQPDYGRTIPTGTVLDEPNLITDLSDIKWKELIPDWVLDNNFIPIVPEQMCDCEVVGAWEGGGTYTYGVYRSQEYCAMDAFMCSAGDEFCAACHRALDDALLPCGILAWVLGDFRQLKTLIWEMPPCFACNPTSELAEESERAMEFDTIIMKLLYRSRPPRLPGPPPPDWPQVVVYNDWFEPTVVRTIVHEDELELSFMASRIRTYTFVLEAGDAYDLDEIDVELYRNGVREKSFGR